MRTSYASILGAVANVLDLAEARSFTVREGEHGLTLDLVDGRGERHAVELSVADVAELVTWSEKRSERVASSLDGFESLDGLDSIGGRDDGSLRAFLERHTLVGAH